MAKAVGIDIGSRNLKILELEKSRNGLTINFFRNIEIPFGIGSEDSNTSNDVLVEAINSIFREEHLERDNVILSLPTQDCILREITVDFKDEEHIRQTIKYEAEKYLLSYEIDDVIVDYRKLGTSQDKTKLFVASVPKKIIQQRLELLKLCNIDPISIDLDIMALVNVSHYVPEVAEKDNIAILDFGAGSSKLVIISQGQLRHVRAIRLGTSFIDGVDGNNSAQDNNEEQDIDWEMENQLIVSLAMPDGIDMDRMVVVKKDQDGNPNVALQNKKKNEFFKRLLKEIRRTMLTLDMEEPLDLVCITGGGSQIEGVLETISNAFQIPTMFLDFSPTILVNTDNLEETIVTAPIALGMTLELIDDRCQMMNFRKEEFVYTNRFEFVKAPLAILLTLFLVFLGLISYQMINLYMQKSNELSIVREKCDPLWQEIFKDEPIPDAHSKIYDMRSKVKDLLEEKEANTIPKLEDGFLNWGNIFKTFNEVRNSGKFIIITKFSLSSQEITWEGEMETDTILDTLKNKLTQQNKDIIATPYEDKIRTQSQDNPKPSDEKLKRKYTIEITLKQNEEEE
jgi:type IV pilus assembly protein PilM